MNYSIENPSLTILNMIQFLRLTEISFRFDWISHPKPISQSTIDGKWHDWGAVSLISVGGRSLQKSLQIENSYFQILSHF